MITPQEAYNKGLDVAENDAYEKISKALDGLDVGPFTNPKMENLRQKVLIMSNQKSEISFLKKFFNREDINENELTSFEVALLKLFNFCRKQADKKTKSTIPTMMRSLLRGIEVDILKNNDKLN